MQMTQNLWLVFPDSRERQMRETDRDRESWWVVTLWDERSFSLGVLQRWRTVLPQLCCSCLNSIQDLKRKTQLRWLLTRQASATVNNSSSPAHTVMLFTLRINKLLLWVCVCCEAKGRPQCFPSGFIKKYQDILNQTVFIHLKLHVPAHCQRRHRPEEQTRMICALFKRLICIV